jgi:hypothetical protein
MAPLNPSPMNRLHYETPLAEEILLDMETALLFDSSGRTTLPDSERDDYGDPTVLNW